MNTQLPETLHAAITYFSTGNNALCAMVAKRWPDGVSCPHCESREVRFMEKRSAWQCRGCRKQFTVKVGTIFEDSPIKLDKWLVALWLITNAKNGISSCELGRSLGVTQKTAWFMLHRIRLAMQNGSFMKAGGQVEVDESWIGGSARFMHKGHTNGLENFWSLLKRMIKGTYVSIKAFHLFRYLDEQAFRFNERKEDDLGRFLITLAGIFGKRLTWNKLTGKSDGFSALKA